jgi:pimeloyl-ACP methyl ester carboxylesterase
VLALQGWQDEYGTMNQVQRLAERAAHARWVGIDACGHSPFIDQPQRVIDECRAFAAQLALA